MIAIMTLILSLGAVAANSDICKPYQLKPQYASEDKKFESMMQLDWEQNMKDYPEWGSDLGYKGLADKWTDDSLEAINKRKKQLDCVSDNFKKIQRTKLSEFNKVNYDLYQERLNYSLEGLKFPGEYLVLTQMNGVHTDVVDTMLQMPEATAQDVENKLARLEKIPIKIAQHTILLKEGLKKGVTIPQVVLTKVPAQFDKILTDKVTDSALYAPFKDLKSFSAEQRTAWQSKAQQIIAEKLYPVMKDFKKFLSEEYIPGARKTISIQDLPNGKAWYDWSVRRMTTTTKTPEEIHQIGLNEVARITKEMTQIRDQVGFKKDLKAFNQYLLTDPKFVYTDAKDLLMGYRDIAKRVDAELPKLFKTLPRMPYGVREMPSFNAETSPGAYYYQGSAENGRAGYFVANTYDLKARHKWSMEALTLHEAVPGHHLQIAISQELGDMPEFRKNDGYTAFGEGWGLYAESLGDKLGFYTDPYSHYGQLTYEMWRAIRLVVDTGIHDKGWTREQALKYFADNLAKSPLEIQVEVDRYIVWPGQALAYKMGQLKILELRERSQKTLGEKFDIRQFHDVVLSGGALPLNVLEKRVDEWAQKTAKAGAVKTGLKR